MDSKARIKLDELETGPARYLADHLIEGIRSGAEEVGMSPEEIDITTVNFITPLYLYSQLPG